MRLLLVAFLLVSSSSWAGQIRNPLIDYNGFSKIVVDSAAQRETRRLTEQQFIEAMWDKHTVILDARSPDRYALRHIKGAVNLPFTDFTAEALARVIPSKTTRVLIYCNNNFEGDATAFPSKMATASLNLSTYTSLRAYGYENIFELGPLLKINTTSISFEGTEVK